jgi:translation initiation factor IF-1
LTPDRLHSASSERHGQVKCSCHRSAHHVKPEDEGIELRALSNRIRTTIGDRVHVNLTSYNRQVLTGEVPSAQDKAAWSNRYRG